MTPTTVESRAFSRWLAGVLTVGALNAACGSDTAPATTDADAGLQPDSDATTDSGPGDSGDGASDSSDGNDGSSDGASLDTTPPPGEPAYAELVLTPAFSVYRPGGFVTPRLDVFDAEGQPVADVPAAFTVSPTEAATVDTDSGRVTFSQEGPLRMEGCVTGLPEETRICAIRQVQVDAGPPTLVIISPEPGEEFLFTEVRDGIRVAGTALDSGAAARVFVNGVRVDVTADGSFDATVPAVWGINHLEVVASDVLQVSDARQAVDVMVAADYLDYATEGSAIDVDFPNAITLQLNQEFLDANLSALPDADGDELTTSDLAGVLELVFQELELASLVPDPVVSSSQITLRVLDVDPGTPQVDITVTERGVEIYVDIPELFLATSGSAVLGDARLDLDGGVYVALTGYVRMRLRQRSEEPIEVAVELFDLAVDENGVRGEFVSPQANAVVALVGSSLNAPITNLARDLVQEQFLDQLPELLRGAFASIDDLLAAQTLPLDLGFGTPITLTVNAATETIIPSRRNSLTVTLAAGLGVDRSPTSDSRGIAMDVPYATPPSLLQNSRVQIAARLPFINGLLHAVWNGGLLNLDVTSVLPEAVSILVDTVEVDGRLPPLLRASRPGESDYDLLITLGQLEIILGKGGLEDRIGAYITVGANLEVVGNVLTVELQPEPSLDFWLISFEGEFAIFENPEDLESLILTAVWPEVAGDLVGNLAIELPRLGLDAIGDLAPSLSTFGLNVVLDRPVILREGYLIIDGGLDGANAAP